MVISTALSYKDAVKTVQYLHAKGVYSTINVGGIYIDLPMSEEGKATATKLLLESGLTLKDFEIEVGGTTYLQDQIAQR